MANARSPRPDRPRAESARSRFGSTAARPAAQTPARRAARRELGLEGGPALRQTNYVLTGNSSDFAGRVAGNFVWNIGATTAFTETASYFFGGETNTFTSDTALTTKLYGSLSARISFFLQNESNPQPGLEATDTTTRFTLVYGF